VGNNPLTPTFTIVTPTIGRPTLKRTLDTIVPQLRDGDEMLVVGDGPQPAAYEMVRQLNSPLVHYWEYGPVFNYGNPQRNIAIERATAQWLHFIDDDDEPASDGILLMRRYNISKRRLTLALLIGLLSPLPEIFQKEFLMLCHKIKST